MVALQGDGGRGNIGVGAHGAVGEGDYDVHLLEVLGHHHVGELPGAFVVAHLLQCHGGGIPRGAHLDAVVAEVVDGSLLVGCRRHRHRGDVGRRGQCHFRADGDVHIQACHQMLQLQVNSRRGATALVAGCPQVGSGDIVCDGELIVQRI